nr:LOW QUALITY PROTEIN: regulator of chromosome condensation-like [Rhipicephalus microplus]
MPRRKAAETQSSQNAVPAKRKKGSLESAASAAPSVKKPRLHKEVSVERRSSPGNVYTVGQGDVGQLGLGPDVMECSRPAQVQGLKDVVDVVAGGMHTLCLTADGKVWSFGCNDEGALGRQTVEPDNSETTPGIVELPEAAAQVTAGGLPLRCASPCPGKSTSGATSAIPEGRWASSQQERPSQSRSWSVSDILQIASGSDHVAMLTAKGDLLTMGCGEQGQLGRLPTRTAPRRACAACTRAAQAHQSLHTQTQRSIRVCSSLLRCDLALCPGCKTRAFDRVWAAAYATFVRLRETGRLYGCGLNNYHQMGAQAQSSSESGTVISVPQPLTSCDGHRWKLVSGGQHHTLLLSEEGAVFSLGRKEYGRLGLGESTPAGNNDQDKPAPVPGLSDCVDVSCGEAVSYAIDREGQLALLGLWHKRPARPRR